MFILSLVIFVGSSRSPEIFIYLFFHLSTFLRFSTCGQVCELLKAWLREHALDENLAAKEVQAYRDFCREMVYVSCRPWKDFYDQSVLSYVDVCHHIMSNNMFFTYLQRRERFISYIYII